MVSCRGMALKLWGRIGFEFGPTGGVGAVARDWRWGVLDAEGGALTSRGVDCPRRAVMRDSFLAGSVCFLSVLGFSGATQPGGGHTGSG